MGSDFMLKSTCVHRSRELEESQPLYPAPPPLYPAPPHRPGSIQVSQNLNHSEVRHCEPYGNRHPIIEPRKVKLFCDSESETRSQVINRDQLVGASDYHRLVHLQEENYESSFDSEEFSETLSVEDQDWSPLHRYNNNNNIQDTRPQHQQQSFNQMGEEKRLFVSNSARGGVETASAGHGGVGSRLQRNKNVASGKRLGAVVTTGSVGGGGRDNLNGGAGDSDGMMGSGGESDSSEEIHYGPGFVSRLKSRYMSVALRGSPRGSLGTLRRTASLEDFLDLTESEARVSADVSPMLKYSHRINQPTQRVTQNKVRLT